MTTRNLLSETEERLDMLGLTPNDVWWVGSDSGVYWTTWQGFKELAKDVNYEPDCYRPQIPTDLIIMLEANKGCLARRTLGGGNGEWWDFHHWPEKHMFGHKEIVRLYDPHFHDDMETYCEEPTIHLLNDQYVKGLNIYEEEAPFDHIDDDLHHIEIEPITPTIPECECSGPAFRITEEEVLAGCYIHAPLGGKMLIIRIMAQIDNRKWKDALKQCEIIVQKMEENTTSGLTWRFEIGGD